MNPFIGTGSFDKQYVLVYFFIILLFSSLSLSYKKRISYATGVSERHEKQ